MRATREQSRAGGLLDFIWLVWRRYWLWWGEPGPNLVQAMSLAGREKAKVTHLDKALGQHMLQEATDEFKG